MSHYQTLGVGKDASPDVIRAAYRLLARRYHPDMNPGETAAGAEAMFKDVQAAYDELSDPDARKRYDETGTATEPPSLEAESRKFLMDLFNAALDHDDDLVAKVKAYLGKFKTEMEGARAQHAAKLKRLEKRSGRVKVKTGDNLAQMLIDQKIGQLKADIAQCDHALLVRDAAVVMVENYEHEVMDAPTPPVVWHQGAWPPVIQGLSQQGPVG